MSLHLWLAGPAGSAPREVARELVTVDVDGVDRTVYVIVWDRPLGPVLYFAPLYDDPAVDWHQLVWQLCNQLLDQRAWAGAALIEPMPVSPSDDNGPWANVHSVRFTADSATGRQLLAPGETRRVVEVARSLGAELPVWVTGTLTVATARAALASPETTVVVPDTTAWPHPEGRLRLAIRVGLPDAYPLAWAALATDDANGPLRWRLKQAAKAERLGKVPALEYSLPDRGDGWYLVARPEVPVPAGRFFRLLSEAVPPADPDVRHVAEMTALRTAAGEMDRDDPRSELYLDAVARLQRLMSRERVKRITRSNPEVLDPNEVETAYLLRSKATWGGPVVETWLRTLTPVPDLTAALRTRRVATLLDFGRRMEFLGFDGWRLRPGEVREAYRDPAGRYILVAADADGPDPTPWMCAEWPTDAAVAEGWTGDTVLAADRPVPGTPAGPLLALTPGVDGTTRIDPFPASPSHGGHFEFGQDTAEVQEFFRMLLSLALDPDAAGLASSPFIFTTLVEDAGMTLWPALVGATNSLRLRWDTVQSAAFADLGRAQQLLAPDAPTIYRYYAVIPRDHSLIDELIQVVRVHGSQTGHAYEECVAADGWRHTMLLEEIGRGSWYHSVRRLRADEVDEYVAAMREKWAASGRR